MGRSELLAASIVVRTISERSCEATAAGFAIGGSAVAATAGSEKGLATNEGLPAFAMASAAAASSSDEVFVMKSSSSWSSNSSSSSVSSSSPSISSMSDSAGVTVSSSCSVSAARGSTVEEDGLLGLPVRVAKGSVVPAPAKALRAVAGPIRPPRAAGMGRVLSVISVSYPKGVFGVKRAFQPIKNRLVLIHQDTQLSHKIQLLSIYKLASLYP